MVGPDYKNPNETIGTSELFVPEFKNSHKEWKVAQPQDNYKKEDWWKIYKDEHLNKMMVDCREKNPDLKSLFYRLEQARECACMTESQLYPWIGGNADYFRFQQSEHGVFPNLGVNDDWIAGASLTWDADLFGRVRSMLRAERANAESLLNEYENMLLVLRAQVAQNYFSLKQFEAERRLLLRTVEIRKSETEFIRAKVEVRSSGDVDLQRAIQQEYTTRDELTETENKIAVTKNYLANLLGTSAMKIDLKGGAFSADVPEIPKAFPSELLEHRPDIASAERKVCAANWQIGAAQAAFFPTVTLTSALGTDSTAFSKLTEASTFSWGISPQIYIPIFQAGRLIAQKRVALAKHKQTLEEYRSTVLKAILETENAIASSEHLKRRFDERNIASNAAKKVEDYTQAQYEAGLVDYFAASEAHRYALMNELVCLRLKGERYRNSVSLIKALGGSWKSQKDYESENGIVPIIDDTLKISVP